MFHQILNSSAEGNEFFTLDNAIGPVLSTLDNASGTVFHTLDNGALITAFGVDLLDEEIMSEEKLELLLLSLIKDLPVKRVLRIILKASFETESAGHSRTWAIREIGFIKYQAFLILEKQADIKLFKSEAQKNVFNEFLTLKEYGIKLRALSKEEIEEIFPKLQEELNHQFQTIDLGHEVVSVLRLTKQSEFGMQLRTLSQVKDKLTPPFLVSCAIEAVPRERSEVLLRRRSKQNASGADLGEVRKYAEAQNDLEDISLNGHGLFKFEWLCLLGRKSEAELRRDREEFKQSLSALGEIYIESVGALESLKSIYPGYAPHLSLLEKDENLISYFPLITRGDQNSSVAKTKRTLALHRRDESLTHLDIFDKSYESFSWCIFGRTGTGKSVLTNAITRALSADENIKIIKIDVGGSHSRETKLLGGIEKTLLLNEPTGLNPFTILAELGATKDAVQILASFLEVLILEEGESKLTKTMKSDIERCIQAYAELSNRKNTLQDFYDKIDGIPRKNLLSRWVGSGVYGNAFARSEEAEARSAKSWTESRREGCPGSTASEIDKNPEDTLLEASRLPDLRSSGLIYFNFSKISQALDPDYAQGGLAAVMAEFNLQMLKKNEHKKRIVFIADETPFFIKKCFNFFNLSIANVRKEGHGFITIAQKSAHVVVNGDTGILDNSPSKIFFSIDGDEESFKARTQTDSDTIEKIKSLTRKQGKYSEALLKDEKGERIIKIRLSPEEYWSYTSKDEDLRKIEELSEACPSLSTKEVIKCLSL